MADTPKGPVDLAGQIVSSAEALQAVEKAVQAAMQNFAATADAEIQKLVQSNLVGPDVSAEMLKLHQATIEKTIEAINNVSLGVLKSGSSK